VRRPTPGGRERLLTSAGRLFEERGVHAVGLQQIIDDCGCGKQMLYREFANKDDLVTAWLGECIDRWAAAVDDATEGLSDDPAAQLVAIVKVSADDAITPGFRGCPVRSTYAEFRDAAHPVHDVAVDYLTAMRERLRDLAEQAGAADPAELADRLMLVIDGVVTNGAVLGANGSAAAAIELATDIVEAGTRPPRKRTPRP
jgi:AcrR family transcriptional regulator